MAALIPGQALVSDRGAARLAVLRLAQNPLHSSAGFGCLRARMTGIGARPLQLAGELCRRRKRGERQRRLLPLDARFAAAAGEAAGRLSQRGNARSHLRTAALGGGERFMRPGERAGGVARVIARLRFRDGGIAQLRLRRAGVRLKFFSGDTGRVGLLI